WRTSQSDWVGVRQVLKMLEAIPMDLSQPRFSSDDRAYCSSLLQTGTAVEQHRSDAQMWFARTDSIEQYSTTTFYSAGQLIMARLLEANGDPGAARRVVRAMPIALPSMVQYTATYWRENGRLAAVQGDTAAALNAYHRYLELRSDPEPALRAE